MFGQENAVPDGGEALVCFGFLRLVRGCYTVHETLRPTFSSQPAHPPLDARKLLELISGAGGLGLGWREPRLRREVKELKVSGSRLLSCQPSLAGTGYAGDKFWRLQAPSVLRG